MLSESDKSTNLPNPGSEEIGVIKKTIGVIPENKISEINLIKKINGSDMGVACGRAIRSYACRP